MKNPELFHKTVGILVNAYLNDTLQHSNCSACAVGNLIAGNNNFSFIKRDRYIWNEGNPEWQAVHSFCGGVQKFNNSWGDYKTGIRQIKSTGYSPKETALIEYAFETINFICDIEVDMYNGLMSVIDTLMLIHEATTEEANEAKQLFVKEPCSIG